MNLRLIRRVSIWLIAMLAFAQASVVVAACTMERGSMAPMLQMADGCDCETQVKADAPQNANRCVAHCTADLQLTGVASVLVRSPADAPVLWLLPFDERRASPPTGLQAPPLGAIPPRILLHSFLI